MWNGPQAAMHENEAAIIPEEERERLRREHELRNRANHHYEVIMRFGNIEDVLAMMKAIKPIALTVMERE